MDRITLAALSTLFSRFLLLAFVYHTGSTESDVVVTLSHGGMLQGSTMLSTEGQTIYAFRGVRYAEPPIGELRFRPPVQKKGWTDEVVDASKEGPICVQNDIFFKKGSIGEEDCLRLNVYTTQLRTRDQEDKSNTPAAVMVFIHGGGFMGGDGTSVMYGPAHLLDTGVVLVTLNYRLDAFGFLSTGDKASTGNYGLLDQRLALQWVQDNIEQFGGDKHKVTIFGQSAGGGSVSHHLISPMSEGLFHGAIMMSGTGTCPWAINEDPSYWSQRLAKDLDCPIEDNQQLVDCLRKVPAERIVDQTKKYMTISCFPLPFTPTVDGYFIPDHPWKLLHSPDKLNPVPVISGVDEKEGALILGLIKLNNPEKSLTSEDFVTNIIDVVFGRHKPIPEVTDMIKETYFASVNYKDDNQVEAAIINALSDGLFDMCHYETINGLAQAGWRTYAYSYDYMSSFSVSEPFGTKRQWGVTHGDELPMLFSMNVPEFKIQFTERDEDMKRKVLTLWSNFAKYGTAVPLKQQATLLKWARIEETGIPIYHINETTELKTYNLLNNKKYQFWINDVRKARSKQNEYRIKEEL